MTLGSGVDSQGKKASPQPLAGEEEEVLSQGTGGDGGQTAGKAVGTAGGNKPQLRVMIPGQKGFMSKGVSQSVKHVYMELYCWDEGGLCDLFMFSFHKSFKLSWNLFAKSDQYGSYVSMLHLAHTCTHTATNPITSQFITVLFSRPRPLQYTVKELPVLLLLLSPV